MRIRTRVAAGTLAAIAVAGEAAAAARAALVGTRKHARRE